ncbi:MAG TPA: hypothetical protein VFV38_12080 [Ktedonobacteraceae bacterium]|nr:hypothetical protein [Ktedonobacteraceae bacterium]
MNYVDFPPFPTPGEKGPQVCAAVRFYLAIVNDLPFERAQVLSEHVHECTGCAAEFRLLQRATRLVATLPESAPSARVDEAVLAALKGQGAATRASIYSERQTEKHLPTLRAYRLRRRSGMWALAATLVILILAGVFLRGLIWPIGNSAAFQLPANLSWSGYVMHYTQIRLDGHGQSYQVEVYQDLGTNQMHIESMMQGQFDVVVVTTPSTMLGKDMMHHIAQEGHGVANWAIDGSLFDLSQLRHDLTMHHATYLGQGTFQGQTVYQVRANNGQVLLLNQRYLPVGALRHSPDASIGKALYNRCDLLPATQVSDSMWDMSIPPDFRMGTLPNNS